MTSLAPSSLSTPRKRPQSRHSCNMYVEYLIDVVSSDVCICTSSMASRQKDAQNAQEKATSAPLIQMHSCHHHIVTPAAPLNPALIQPISTFCISFFMHMNKSVLHSSSRHGSFDTFRRKTAFNAAFRVLLLLHCWVLLAHVGHMRWPTGTVANRHADADLIMLVLAPIDDGDMAYKSFES